MYVFDSYALLVLFNRQNGWEIVREHLFDAEHELFRHLITAINYGEFYYTEAIKHGFEHAELSLEFAKMLPLKVVVPSFEQIMEAAHLKGGGGLSYADCFAASLALELNVPVLTGDPEFEKLLGHGLKVEWLPSNR